ncbi:polymorphic toxin-type HINT domain-containing protein, partial [Streptomyces chitinivorans]|uniref:polymorphic toxin-type HINT domain-containing protein n=1 Tax=Streptomyces chitinivorans TaxID=1257027 RepID=UPI0031EDB93D
ARAAARMAAQRRAAVQARQRAARAAARRAQARRAAARKAKPKPRSAPRSRPKPKRKPSQQRKPAQRRIQKAKRELADEARDNVVDAVTNGGGCPTSNSFAPGTLVLMADGSRRPIEEIKVGDKVLATDPKTGETKAKTVTATIIGDGAKDLVKVTIRTTEATPSAVVAGDRDGSGGDQSPPTSTADHGDRGDRDGADTSATASVVATDGHPFWVPELGEWLDADELKSGQWLQTSSGTWVQITAIESWTQRATVHNLTVEGIHTYHALAGATPLLVHNCNDGKDKYADVGISDGHIVYNHTPEGMNSNDHSKTEWLPGTTKESRAEIIKQVLRRGWKVHDTKNLDGIAMEFRFSNPIGRTRDVRPISLHTMRVYYDPAENYVRNAFPVIRRRKR